MSRRLTSCTIWRPEYFFNFFKLATCFGVVPFPVATYSFRISSVAMADIISWCVASNCKELPVTLEFDVLCFTFVFWRENECSYTIFPMVQQPLLCQGLIIIEASWSHSDTSHSVELLWKSYRPDAETSTWQHKTLTIDTSILPAEFEPTIS